MRYTPGPGEIPPGEAMRLLTEQAGELEIALHEMGEVHPDRVAQFLAMTMRVLAAHMAWFEIHHEMDDDDETT
jgi:hypothetical protein